MNKVNCRKRGNLNLTSSARFKAYVITICRALDLADGRVEENQIDYYIIRIHKKNNDLFNRKNALKCE